MRRTALPGTSPSHGHGASARVPPADAGRPLRVTVVLRPRASGAFDRALDRHAAAWPPARRVKSCEDVARAHGAAAADLARVRAYGESCGLRTVRANTARRILVFAGTRACFERAFGVAFVRVRRDGQEYLSHRGPVRLPARVAACVESVVGLDERPVARVHPLTPVSSRSRAATARTVSVAYRFPTGATGRGQTVAVILPNGGFHAADLAATARRWRVAVPGVAVVNVEGRSNQPAPRGALRAFLARLHPRAATAASATRRRPSDPARAPESSAADAAAMARILWTVEATMDIALVSAFAPGARIVVYFAPDTARGKYEAFSRALFDRTHRPSVISCSWGMREDDVPPGTARAFDRLFRTAALLGVTICCSSGDAGADADGTGPRVHFPASSPHVLACGGTRLPAGPDLPETAWREQVAGRHLATGGGFSRVFPMPAWQRALAKRGRVRPRGRGVPDVAGHADFDRGYDVVVGGAPVRLGGTSAATPMWAALVAVLNESLGTRVGWLTPLLYRDEVRAALRDVHRGSAGYFRAVRGWDACTGLGSPDGEALLAALRASPARRGRRR